MKKERGFTLVEMMMIIAIIGILTAVSVPNFLVWLPGWRARSAARDLYSNMHLARMSAIKNRQDCTVTFASGPDRYIVSCLNRTVILADYGSGVCFQGPGGETFDAASLNFSARGFTDPGYAYLSEGQGNVFYRVGPGPLSAGVLRLEKRAGAVWE